MATRTTNDYDLIPLSLAAQIIGIGRTALYQRVRRGSFPAYAAPTDWQQDGGADEPRLAVRRVDAEKARQARELAGQLSRDAAPPGK